MEPDKQSSNAILVASPEPWAHLVCHLIEQHDHVAILTTSYIETVQVCRDHGLSGIVVTFEWAIPDTHGDRSGVLELVYGRIPTITMLRRSHESLALYEQIYRPPKHLFCIVPFDVEELQTFMQHAGMFKAQML